MAESTAEERSPDTELQSVLVTGGTGFLGLHTCQHFAEQGLEVVALDIDPFERDDETTGIDFVEADVRDAGAVERAITAHQPDAVVHAAAALPLWDDATIREVTVEGTRKVLSAALEAGVDRVVYISSTAVYGTHDTHPITEQSPLDGVGPYGEAKIEAERVCRQFRDEGLVVPILRPKTFIGPKRLGVFQILFDWVEDGASIPMVGWGNNRYQLLHVRDLVRAIELMLTEQEAVVDDVFNVGAVEYGTMKEDFGALPEHAGTGKRAVGTPATLTVLALRVLNAFDLSPLYPWVYETAHEDSYVSVDKLQAIGWTPEYSNEEALIGTYEWYLQNYEPKTDPGGHDHRVAWDQGALKVAKQFFKLI